MDSISIKNFTRRDDIEVRSTNFQGIEPLVTLKQRAGSLDFQFDMTPGQARYLAQALIQHADHIEYADTAPSTLRRAA